MNLNKSKWSFLYKEKPPLDYNKFRADDFLESCEKSFIIVSDSLLHDKIIIYLILMLIFYLFIKLVVVVNKLYIQQNTIMSNNVIIRDMLKKKL
jgi:hypothetical protein